MSRVLSHQSSVWIYSSSEVQSQENETLHRNPRSFLLTRAASPVVTASNAHISSIETELLVNFDVRCARNGSKV